MEKRNFCDSGLFFRDTQANGDRKAVFNHPDRRTGRVLSDAFFSTVKDVKDLLLDRHRGVAKKRAAVNVCNSIARFDLRKGFLA